MLEVIKHYITKHDVIYTSMFRTDSSDSANFKPQFFFKVVFKNKLHTHKELLHLNLYKP